MKSTEPNPMHCLLRHRMWQQLFLPFVRITIEKVNVLTVISQINACYWSLRLFEIHTRGGGLPPRNREQEP